MSTNHTPNYALSQWQAADQVLRTDFNEDNAKIDAALASKVAKVVLHDITLTEPTTKIEFDIMAEEWWKYRFLTLHVLPGQLASGNKMTFRAGKSSKDSYHATFGESGTREDLWDTGWSEPTTFLFIPGGSKTVPIFALFLQYNIFQYAVGPTYESAKTISILGEAIPAGTKIKVTGIL